MTDAEPRHFGVKVKDDYYVCSLGDAEAQSFNVHTDEIQSHPMKPGSPYTEKVSAVIGGLESGAQMMPEVDVADDCGPARRFDSVLYVPDAAPEAPGDVVEDAAELRVHRGADGGWLFLRRGDRSRLRGSA